MSKGSEASMDVEYLGNGEIHEDGAWGDCRVEKRGKQDRKEWMGPSDAPLFLWVSTMIVHSVSSTLHPDNPCFPI